MIAFEGDNWIAMNTTVSFAAHSGLFESAQSDVSQKYINCYGLCY